MKNIFLGLGITLCGILSILIVMTISGKNFRQNELNRAVDSAMEDTVINRFDEKTYTVGSKQEWIADFMEALLVQINSECSIEINILDADEEKGLLSVEVVEKYMHPLGTEGMISVKRTVILEQYRSVQ